MDYAADRALQVAIEMERMGKTLYESLAAGAGNKAISELAARLAVAEARHIEVFSKLRDSLPEERRGPALDDRELDEASMAQRNRLLPDAATIRKVVLSGRPAAAIDMAMEAEAAEYYQTLARSPDAADAAVFAQLARDEQDHLRLLRVRRQGLG